MGYNEQLANRVRETITVTHQQVDEIKMFGGICFMVNGKMCAGVQKERLLVRLDPAIFEQAIEEEGCMPMEVSGKVSKGFVLVDGPELTTKKKLEYWLKLALEYNPIAKSSKKKKK
ncbi:MAG: TfoX/Sxy family protein [Ferruginibacter sp.]